jgi:hypothetical protein
MKKIIVGLMVLLFSFGVVGTAIACGGCPTSCANFWESFFQGKYVATSTSYPVASSSSYPEEKYPEYDHDKYPEYDYDKYPEYD